MYCIERFFGFWDSWRNLSLRPFASKNMTSETRKERWKDRSIDALLFGMVLASAVGLALAYWINHTNQ
jgi:hypothetical protein